MVVGEITEKRELVIIGGGPGGYTAAIRASQLGKKVTLIEKDKLGGLCLHEGCIPSKIFALTAKQFSSIATMSQFGVETKETTFHLEQLATYKEQVIKQLQKGIEALCNANEIEIIKGEANFTGPNKIGVERGHQFDVYEFEQAIIATGSETVVPAHLRIDHSNVLLPENVYHVDELPEQLIVYGSDYVSLEVAFSFKQLGVDVTIILDDKEDFPFDHSLNRELKRILKKNKIAVHRGAQMNSVQMVKEHIKITFDKNGEKNSLTSSHLFIAGEQQPTIQSLGIDRLGIEVSTNGFIKTDETMTTSINEIFAIGNTTEGAPLAVKAIKQGKVAAETSAGISSEIDVTFMPTVIHSLPPIATVGLTEKEAKEQGYKVKSSQFPLSGNGYAMITDDKDGLVKVIKDDKTDLLLGFHMIGAGAIQLVSASVTALEMVAREEDLNFPMYPHPSFNEGLMEAIENLSDKAIHMAPMKKSKMT